jgi:hypothetical protein
MSRFRHCQICIYTVGAGEMFQETKTVFFQNYTGNGKALIYIPNDGFKTVELSTLSTATTPAGAVK